MNRVNTLSWSRTEYLMRRLCSTQCELIKWQKHTLPHETLATNGGFLHGDQNVMVELIELKKLIEEILETSKKQ